ncbi:E3 ubiquitin-protein ligase TRIM71-like [Amphiura filiformis]|uniref:E3 ubiquitin-protein ligase TRIM71-like n=1 Tax=Amphiura filiformis TaxID=82378 RepID=UPI003B20CC06
MDDDIIQCRICHIVMEDPRSLACLHTFCLECLRGWAQILNTEDGLICPLCHEVTPLASNGVDGLNSNSFVTKLKDMKAISLLMDNDVKIMCTACDGGVDNEAVARCVECEDFLCSNCTKAHKIVRLTKNHSVLSLVELKTGKVSLIKKTKKEHCKEHTDQVLWFYCKTCDVPICRDCTVVEHPTGSHELVKLDTATTGQREEIQGLVAKCKDVRRDVDEAIQKINKKQENFESTCSMVTRAVDRERDEVEKNMLLMLQKQADDLKKSIAAMKTTRNKLAITHQDHLQWLKSRLNTALQMGIKVSTDGSSCDIAAAYKPLITTLKQLEKVQIPTFDLGDIEFINGRSPATFVNCIGRIEEKQMTSAQL